jgi:hypothetical protein
VTPRWEYLIVIFDHAAKLSGEASYTYTNTHYLWRRGCEEAEVRSEANWVDLLNELGDDGWELVESEHLRSTIISKYNGYNEVSFPLRIRSTFKRRSDAGVQG